MKIHTIDTDEVTMRKRNEKNRSIFLKEMFVQEQNQKLNQKTSYDRFNSNTC